MSKPVSINDLTCQSVAEKLKKATVRSSFYDRPFLRTVAAAETALRGYFYSVAICHQTYHLYNTDLNLYGWDYLEFVFTKLMNENSEMLHPGYFARQNSEILQEIVKNLFPRDAKTSLTSLDRVIERVKMLKEFDNFIEANFDSKLLNLVSITDSRLLKNGKGFYEILPNVNAFSDPMKKKITFLIKLLEEAGLVIIKDPENFIPIMDYHMQRVLLRLGCIEVNDFNLRKKLLLREKLESDQLIREACINAFKIIAFKSGIKVTKLNDYFWSLGRSCCNEKPLCEYHRCEKQPCTFYELIELNEHNDCFFNTECKGFKNQEYRNLWQPVVETHYY
jgi:hypothetical protein